MTYAAVDLGTNAFRLLIVDKKRKKVLKRYSSIIGLGSYISKTNILSPPKSYYKVLDKIFKYIKDFEVKKVRVVGTSIFRDSLNKEQIHRDFYRRYKVKLEIISPSVEAKLTSIGALHPLTFNNENCLVIDIGGGSTEVVLVKESKIKKFISMKIGVVREFNFYKISDFIDTTFEKRIFNDLEKKITSYKFFNSLKDNKFKVVMNGGTPTTLAAIKLKMKKYDPKQINGYKLSSSYIKSVFRSLIEMKSEDRLRIYGMEKGREIVIIYGVFILLSLLKILKKRIVYVSDSGILEGLIQEINWFLNYDDYIQTEVKKWLMKNQKTTMK